MAELYASELEAAERSTLDTAQDVVEYASHLSQTIGPRPAGTEEEQQASFYIEGLMKDGAGLKTEIEEFRCTPNYELPRVVCCIVSAVLAVLSVALPLTIVPALIITLILAVLYAMETFGLNIIGKVAKKGISQNVVARYIPEAAQGGAEAERSSRRKRKIIVVAHYDTGKVRAELKGPLFGVLNIVHWVELVCMILIPLILLIRLAFTAGGVFLTVLNVLVVIAAIGAFLPVISYILHQTAQYNNGANCNAAGVAVMAEVARRIGRELPATDFADNVSMSGEDAVRASGLIPEGASLTYNSGQVSVIGAQSAPLEVMGAQAVGLPNEEQMHAEFVSTGQAFPPSHTPSGAGVDAIFEGIGKTSDAAGAGVSAPVASASQETGAMDAISAQPEDASVPAAAVVGAAGAAVAGAVAGVAVGTASQDIPPAPAAPEPDDGVPDWFKRGRQKAMEHKPHDESGPTLVQRSRFADALDAAAASTAEAQAQAERAESAPSIAEQRLQQMRESIMGQAAGAQNSLRNAVHGTPADQSAAAAAGTEAASQPEQPQAAAPGVTGHNAGVGGYLSNTLASPDYETAAAAQEAAAAADAAGVASKAAAEATVASATAAALATDAAQLAAQAEAKASAERAAIANRTMSFIPVALDPNEMKMQSEALKSQEATAQAAASAAVPAAVSAQDADAADAHKRKRREIALPSLTGAIEGVSAKLQDAPIDEIEHAEPTEQEKRASRMARQEKLAASLPSTTGSSSVTHGSRSASEGASGAVNVTAGAFTSGTSSFEPVGDELIADVAEDDIYIDDADDSDYIEQTTQTGAFAGPGYVNMPTSRASRMFGRFRKNKKKDEEVSLKDSLGVGDDFDARSVGKARGGWESFRDDNAFDDDWEGGAFSKLKETAANGIGKIGGRGGKASQASAEVAYDEGYAGDGYYDEYGAYEEDFQDGYQTGTADYAGYEEGYDEYGEEDASGRRPRGGRSGARQSRRGAEDGGRMTRKPVANPFGDLPLDFSDNQMDERELIQQFKNGPISTEIWFVALGAEVADNAGIKAFIAEHTQDLRGSVVVDLNGLGAGELSVIEEEGMFRPAKVSSRLKRYANKAANALGMRLGSGKMLWRDSAAYISLRRGYQTLHIAGMKDGKPAYCAQADDVFENLSEEKLRQNSDFVMELIRNI